MQTIWKFPVPATDEGTILEMPRGAKILTVQAQGTAERPELWAFVDPRVVTELRTFRTYGTEQLIEHEAGRYVATYQLRDGGLRAALLGFWDRTPPTGDGPWPPTAISSPF